MVIFVTGRALTVLVNEPISPKWMIDSACTTHFMKYDANFKTFTPLKGSVQPGSEEFLRTWKVGIIEAMALVEGSKTKITFHEMYYPPNILCNLMSSSRTKKMGFRTVIDDGDDNPVNVMLEVMTKEPHEVMLVAPETPEGCMRLPSPSSRILDNLLLVSKKKSYLYLARPSRSCE